MASNISQNGLDFIKKEEGFKATPYKDNRGTDSQGRPLCSIGHGTLALCSSGPISKSDAEAAMLQHLQNEVIGQINGQIGINTLNQNQFDALCSLVYNVGYYNVFSKVYNNGYTKGSTIYNKIIEGDLDAAGKAFNTTGWALKNRRTRERELWESGTITTGIGGAPQNVATQTIENFANTVGVNTELLYALGGALLVVLLIMIFRKRYYY